MSTTIQIQEKLKNKLEDMKLYPRETYNDIINRLINVRESETTLSKQTLINIEHALEDVKKGRTYSTKEVRKRLGIG